MNSEKKRYAKRRGALGDLYKSRRDTTSFLFYLFRRRAKAREKISAVVQDGRVELLVKREE